MWDHDTCISELHGLINTGFLSTTFLCLTNYEYSPGKRAGEAKTAWTAFWVIAIGLVLAAAGAYLIYKHRLRVSSYFVVYACPCINHHKWRLMTDQV